MAATGISDSRDITHSALVTKLSYYLKLEDAERRRLAYFESSPRTIAPREVIVRQDEPYRNAAVLVDGWCLKYKLLDDGRRQVVNFVLPGSFIGLHANVFDFSDHSISTLTSCRISSFDPQTITTTFAELPRLGAAIVWDAAREEAFLMERLVSLGRRSAYERFAHLVVELIHLMARRG